MSFIHSLTMKLQCSWSLLVVNFSWNCKLQGTSNVPSPCCPGPARLYRGRHWGVRILLPSVDPFGGRNQVKSGSFWDIPLISPLAFNAVYQFVWWYPIFDKKKRSSGSWNWRGWASIVKLFSLFETEPEKIDNNSGDAVYLGGSLMNL